MDQSRLDALLEGPERGRITFLIERNGLEGAHRWALRTLRSYRRAVLDRDVRHGHHAASGEYRRRFIEAYCHFKRFVLGVGR